METLTKAAREPRNLLARGRVGKQDPKRIIENRLDRIEARLEEAGKDLLAENERVFILERISHLRRLLNYSKNRTRAAANLTADLAFFGMTTVAYVMQDLAWDLRLLDLEWAAFVRHTF